MASREQVDGSSVYSDLCDWRGYAWHILVRAGGSVSLYGTRPELGGHAVLYDTLDNQPPSAVARELIAELSDIAEGINILLAAVQTQPTSEQVVTVAGGDNT